ncbi:MAG: inositol monophosphatase [Deltaproteobacteria bacterium]|nr:inositol monophosphatase [Deltaproteobacteria bacterium]
MDRSAPPDIDAIARRRDAALVIAREAAALLQTYKLAPDAHLKGVGDLVTAADKASEVHILGRLGALFPDDAVIAEEGGARERADAEWLWCVDPLDGTTNFVHGLPHYGVSIGALHRGVPTVGVIVAPELGPRVWVAGRGLGATVDGRPIRVSANDRLDLALVATGHPYDRSWRAAEIIPAVGRALTHCLDVRRLGSAALDLAHVAQGTFGVFWEPRLKVWDLVAGVVLVEEAGGRVSDHAGGDGYLDSGDVVASNGVLHERFLRDVIAR